MKNATLVVNLILEGTPIQEALLYEAESFKKGDIVVAKDEFIEPHETLEDTAGVVVDYNPDNDYLVIGTLHPERYAIGSTHSMRGCFYRLATQTEINSFK